MCPCDSRAAPIAQGYRCSSPGNHGLSCGRLQVSLLRLRGNVGFRFAGLRNVSAGRLRVSRKVGLFSIVDLVGFLARRRPEETVRGRET